MLEQIVLSELKAFQILNEKQRPRWSKGAGKQTSSSWSGPSDLAIVDLIQRI